MFYDDEPPSGPIRHRLSAWTFTTQLDFVSLQAVSQIPGKDGKPVRFILTHTDGGSLTTFGLNGGWISRFASRSQSMRRKKTCSLMSISPSGPQPRRLDGCLVISW